MNAKKEKASASQHPDFDHNMVMGKLQCAIKECGFESRLLVVFVLSAAIHAAGGDAKMKIDDISVVNFKH